MRIAGAVGAIVVGAGVAALASNVTSSSSNSSNSTSTSAQPATTVDDLVASSALDAKKALGRRGVIALRHLEHAEWVSRDKGANVTHDAIRGGVTSVSAGAITVKAQDGFTLTFAANSGTAVVLRESGKGSRHKAAMGDVKDGDNVLVAGTKSGTALTAKHVLDVGK